MSIQMTKHSSIKIFLHLVFLSTVSLLQGQTLLTASLNSPGGAGILSENCGGPYELVIRRGVDNDTNTEIYISGSGVAILGTDYWFPGTNFPVLMQILDTVVVIPIAVVNDGFTEGSESVHLEIAFLAGLESDFISLETAIVDGYDVEIQSPTDTIVWCRNVPYVLQATTDAEEIFWSPANVFDDSLGTAATVRPFESGWYFASVGTDACGASDSVYFDLAIVEIANPDTVYICIDGNGIQLQGNLENLATEFDWIPADSTLSNPNILNPIANPTLTTTYILQSDIGICVASDRVVVRVDSLPSDLHIDIAPSKPYYCAGEIVALFSPSYDSLSFPDITFRWNPDDGTFESELDLLNAALKLQDTTLYIRENINNACRSADSILINVVPSSVPLSVSDTMLCPGETFDVLVLSDQVTEPQWTPEQGLSCTACLNPTVTVIGAPGSSLFYEFSGKINECPVGATLTVRIPSVQTILIDGDPTVCSGEMIQLTITNPAGLSGIQWTIQHGNATLSCTNCPNPIVTVNSNDQINLIVTADTETDSCGASGFFQMNPGIQPQFNSAIGACLGGTVSATTGHPAFTDVVWDITQGQLALSCNQCPSPVVTVNSPGKIRFFAEVSGPDTCRVSGEVTIFIHPRDEANIIVVPDPFGDPPIGQGAEVTASLVHSPLPASVMWRVNGSSIGSTATTITFNASEEINLIEATYINSKGCEQTDTISFPTVPPTYMIPNAFTPENGDELNNTFRIIINGELFLDEFLIFNRWGQLVYDAAEGDLMGWDGRFKGEPAVSDTYVYSAKLRFPDGHTEVAKGDVMLLR